LSHVNAKGKGINSKGWVGNQVFRWLDREKSEISARDLQKPFEEFKTVNSILLTKYCSHHTEISTKDIVTLPQTKNLVIYGSLTENICFANCNTSPW
jgi:hypothetical protein